MTDTVVAALITGGLAFIGVVITCYFSNRKTKEDITKDITEEYRKAIEEMKVEFKVAQEVMKTEVKELTREVREHNNFAKRMPAVETEIRHINEDIHTLQSYHSHK